MRRRHKIYQMLHESSEKSQITLALEALLATYGGVTGSGTRRILAQN